MDATKSSRSGSSIRCTTSLGATGVMTAAPLGSLGFPMSRLRHIRRAEGSASASNYQSFWLRPCHRQTPTWVEQADINDVMLATCLAPAPDGFLALGPTARTEGTGKTKTDLDLSLAQTRTRRATFAADLKAVDTATAVQWDDTKARVDKDWTDLKTLVDKP
jgi:hypothetical protein